MSNWSYRNQKFIFTEAERERVLLDCSNFLANKSRISMHRLPGQNFLAIPDLIADLFERERQKGEDLVFPTAMLDTLLAAQLIRTREPFKVLEYGSLDGRFSWHLAEVLGRFHPESTLVCTYDAIELEWIEQINEAKCLPKLSYLAGDFGNLLLQQSAFDIVVINGRVNYFDPKNVILDAVRLAKEGGVIFCYCDSTPLLESTFKLLFDEREEFEITPSQKVLVGEVAPE